MTDFNHTDKPALRQRPEFQSLLDQLDTKFVHEVDSPGVLNVLSLRLFALHRQRGRLGRTTASNEQASNREAETIPEIKAPNITPSDISKKVTTNKFQLWLSRKRKP